jgi:hypothetical protein
MAFRTIISTLLLAGLAATSPTPGHKYDKPAAFFLAGDSTTAIQSTGGGGWGNGFLSTLQRPAYGVNKGHNGATTTSFVKGGDWAAVLDLVRNATDAYNVFVTIQFGHNDQVRRFSFSFSIRAKLTSIRMNRNPQTTSPSHSSKLTSPPSPQTSAPSAQHPSSSPHSPAATSTAHSSFKTSVT